MRSKLTREQVEDIVVSAHRKSERPDLSNRDLSRSDLSHAYLHKANLSNTNLYKADLNRASLKEANLYKANLSEANLIQAYLFHVNLGETGLCKTNLSEADLRGADIRGADLRSADLSEATMGGTVLIDVDLSAVKGLDSIEHRGPSFIDIHTLYHSKGKIPESFLRGTGAPDTFITYAASLAGEAIQYYSCFISYSSQDEAFAQRLHADLQQKGVRCWFAPEDMKIGDKIRPTIDQSIRVHDKLLVILSENSMQSDWVEDEAETAIEEEKKREETVLFPIRLDDTVMDTNQAWAAKLRRTRHIGDFTRWKNHDAYQASFECLLRDLKAEG